MTSGSGLSDHDDEDRYWIAVYGPDGAVAGEAEIFCASLREAVLLAASTATPFGHGLRSAETFLGRFELALSATEQT